MNKYLLGLINTNSVTPDPTIKKVTWLRMQIAQSKPNDDEVSIMDDDLEDVKALIESDVKLVHLLEHVVAINGLLASINRNPSMPNKLCEETWSLAEKLYKYVIISVYGDLATKMSIANSTYECLEIVLSDVHTDEEREYVVKLINQRLFQLGLPMH